MPTVIPKQPKKERNQITIRLDRHVLQDLEHYCRYLESARDYVINQCLSFIFRKDKAFHLWLRGQGVSHSSAMSGTVEDPRKAADQKPKNGAIQGRLTIAE